MFCLLVGGAAGVVACLLVGWGGCFSFADFGLVVAGAILAL